jgi:hypothetical protein
MKNISILKQHKYAIQRTQADLKGIIPKVEKIQELTINYMGYSHYIDLPVLVGTPDGIEYRNTENSYVLFYMKTDPHYLNTCLKLARKNLEVIMISKGKSRKSNYEKYRETVLENLSEETLHFEPYKVRETKAYKTMLDKLIHIVSESCIVVYDSYSCTHEINEIPILLLNTYNNIWSGTLCKKQMSIPNVPSFNGKPFPIQDYTPKILLSDIHLNEIELNL